MFLSFSIQTRLIQISIFYFIIFYSLKRENLEKTKELEKLIKTGNLLGLLLAVENLNRKTDETKLFTSAFSITTTVIRNGMII